MGEVPILHHYCADDRAEVFDFIREVFSPAASARITTQWRWRYELNPFNTTQGPHIDLIRVGPRLVGMLAAFWLPMWMGGIECEGAGSGTWVVHRDYRGHNLWKQVQDAGILSKYAPPVQIGWSRLPARDIPPLDKTFLKKATATWPSAKKQLTIRLDADVLKWLRAPGSGYQTRINRILRVAMERQPARRKAS